MSAARNRIAAVLVAATLGFATTEASALTASPDSSSSPAVDRAETAAAFSRGASVRVSATELEEGRRFTVTARVQSPRRAKTLTWQRWDIPAHSYYSPSWKPLRTVKVAGRRSITLPRVATGRNTERYRVVVTYKKGRKVTSKPAAAKVWHWVPLRDISSYYSTATVGFGEADVNGRRYKAWGAYSFMRSGSGEMRFTPGRNCKEFRGTLGLTDNSHDGSTGTIGLTNADGESVFTSPTLVPGMTAPMTLKLDRPYRFGLVAANTSPEGVSAWPVVADPRLLCHGL